ncbi:hypothetical protein CgunFtcFv8_004767 [Champsocephalus gunnari]|uniref:Uncharacterized protein n=1 Tax=Champsocephalus gunnari TaxID=52237 RepID=A0AAN8HZ56_CHAGU|nr:hypothetical protein CgunFtcFv8_004767 [Champsocephalus gunnari]
MASPQRLEISSAPADQSATAGFLSLGGVTPDARSLRYSSAAESSSLISFLFHYPLPVQLMDVGQVWQRLLLHTFHSEAVNTRMFTNRHSVIGPSLVT